MLVRSLPFAVLLFTLCQYTVVTAADTVIDEPARPVDVELPSVQIGLIIDGDMKGVPGLIDAFQQEISAVLEGEFKVTFPKSMNLQADGTRKGVARALDTLLDNPETDLILTLGTVGSTEALQRTELAKPVVAPFVLDAELQGAPKGEVGSGVPNLAYINLQTPIDYEVITFRKLAPFQSLGFLIDERDANGIPAVKKFVRSLAYEYSITTHLIPVGDSAAEVIAALPADLDAIMIGPLWQISEDEFSLLSSECIKRQLPSFSMSRYDYVKRGIFATTSPERILNHLARQVSITVQEILLGEEAATLPVAFSKSQKLAINMETARAINIYPSLDYMTGAILINEQRQDIERKVTLQEAVNEALAVNLDLAIAEREVRAGTYQVGEARSALLPQVSLGAGGRVIDDDRAAVGMGTSPEKAWVGSVAASQQIYSESGWAGYSVEKYRQSGREYNRDTVRLDITYQAAVAYFDVLRRKTVEQLQKDNMQLTQANLDRAQIRLSTGVAGPDELYRWQTKFASDRQVVLRAESASIDAMQALNRILNRPLLEEFVAEETDLSDPLLIIGNKLFYELIHNPLYLKRFNSYAVQAGLDISPELRIIDAAIAAQERVLVKTKRDYWLPSFTLEGNVDQILSSSGEGQRNEDISGLDDTDWSVGVFARLPLFEGGRKRATVGKNQEQILRLKTERRSVEEGVSQRILQALNNTRASYPSINLSRDASDAAKRNLQLVTDSYVQGIKSIIDLLDAQNQALSSDLDAANAVYNFLIDLMGVQRSIGEFIIFLPTQEQQAWLESAKTYLQQGSGK